MDRKEFCNWNEEHVHTLKLDMDTPDQDWIEYSDVRLNTKPILNIVGESLAKCASRCD